jgi:hypothetical protein
VFSSREQEGSRLLLLIFRYHSRMVCRFISPITKIRKPPNSRPPAGLESPGEGIVPGREAPVFLAGLVLEMDNCIKVVLKP